MATLNEEEGIGPTMDELQKNIGNQQILVIDGNSKDLTARIAKNMGANVICQKDAGKGDALSKGLKYLNPKADYVVLIDADYTYPAKYIPEMIKILDDHPEVGMVCGSRFGNQLERKAFHNVFYLGNKILAFTHNMLNGITLQDPLTGLRVVRAKILRDWEVKSKGFDVEVELNHHVEREGFSIIEIPIQYRQRLGEKKLQVKHGLTIMKRILLETFHVEPVRYPSFMHANINVHAAHLKKDRSPLPTCN